MKQKLSATWAATPTTNRREPTGSEIATGFPCGPADQKLFNEVVYRLTQGEAEIINTITGLGGLTPNEAVLTQLRDAIKFYVDRLTPKGADRTEAFTAGPALTDIPNVSTFYVAQSVIVTGTTYLDLMGYVAFRNNATSGVPPSLTGRFRVIRLSDNATIVTSQYLGCHPMANGNQVPVTLRAVLQSLDPGISYRVELIVDKGTPISPILVQDPYILALHE